MTEANTYIWRSTVRDYELDLQGRVNNAVYLNYFEHARHLHAKQIGIGFSDLHEAGYDLVLYKITVEYKRSLMSGQAFYVTSRLAPLSPLRFLFINELYLSATEQLCARAQSTVTCLDRSTNKPCVPPQIQHWLNPS